MTELNSVPVMGSESIASTRSWIEPPKPENDSVGGIECGHRPHLAEPITDGDTMPAV